MKIIVVWKFWFRRCRFLHVQNDLHCISQVALGVTEETFSGSLSGAKTRWTKPKALIVIHQISVLLKDDDGLG